MHPRGRELIVILHTCDVLGPQRRASCHVPLALRSAEAGPAEDAALVNRRRSLHQVLRGPSEQRRRLKRRHDRVDLLDLLQNLAVR